ncbi:MAG: hypothetical protein HON27_18450 [Candidatus Marinimicrobia bacterium]|jgi:hypothetical protein|nr:hypothetical protein [Candidatus Neomarinimicrobiota bacterium]MBT5271014.1 hypothetical protein [Candidatus Neomarinimicrobiota bacterium]
MVLSGLSSIMIQDVRAASEGRIEVGKLWIGPTITNYGYMGAFEYPGGAQDFYILEQSNFFSCVNGPDTLVLYGGTLGNELDYSWQNADGLFESWQDEGDGVNQLNLTATSNFGQFALGSLSVEVTSRIRAYNHPDYDDMVVISHRFTNTGSSDLTDLYYGSHLPVDAGASGISYKDLDDYAAYHSATGFTYMYDDDGDDGLSPYLCGQVLLGTDLGSGLDLSQSWTTAHYYQMVNPITGRQDMIRKIKSGITTATGSPGPWSIVNAVGSFELQAGASMEFVMAVIYGEGLEESLQNLESIRSLAANGFTIPESESPPAAPEIEDINVSSRVVELNWNNSAAQALDFKSYRLYKSDVSPIGPWEVLVDTSNTTYVDIGRSGFPLYYSITSIDQSGNESGKWGRLNRTLDAVRPVGKAVTKIDEVIVVPNPYRGGANWESLDYENRIYFTQLPAECTIYIHSFAGDLVARIDHIGSGWADWDLLSLNRQSVASGLYLFRVVTPQGDESNGKFVVIKGER